MHWKRGIITTMHCPQWYQRTEACIINRLWVLGELQTEPLFLSRAFSQWTCLYQRQWALSSRAPVFSCRPLLSDVECRSGWRTARLSASGWTSRPSVPTDPLSLETPNAPAFGPNKQYVCVRHGPQRCWLSSEKSSNYKTSSAKHNVCSPACCSTFKCSLI